MILFLSAISVIFANSKSVIATIDILCVVGNIIVFLLLGHGFSDVIVRAGCLILINCFALVCIFLLTRNKAKRSEKKKNKSSHVVDFDSNIIQKSNEQ